MADKTRDESEAAELAEVDESKVSSDLHTAPKEGGMYRTAEGSYVDAHGNVLKDAEVKRAERVQKIANDKRVQEAAAVPVNTGMAGAPMTQADFDARVASAVAVALARQGGSGTQAPPARTATRGANS